MDGRAQSPVIHRGERPQRKIMMKTQKYFISGSSALLLTFVLVLGACGNGTIPNDQQQVQELPSFEGSFVSSETEAQTIQTGADTQIQTAIADAIAQAPSLNARAARAAAGTSGHYEYNGVSVDYTVNGSTSSEVYPFSYTVKQVATINGTYGGYKINGKYNVSLEYTYSSSSSYLVKYKYDCVYSVSYNGKGMKLIYTGDYELRSSGYYSYNVHYSVYDNKNTRKYNFDYKIKYP
jgi:hypothetical protein